MVIFNEDVPLRFRTRNLALQETTALIQAALYLVGTLTLAIGQMCFSIPVALIGEPLPGTRRLGLSVHSHHRD